MPLNKLRCPVGIISGYWPFIFWACKLNRLQKSFDFIPAPAPRLRISYRATRSKRKPLFTPFNLFPFRTTTLSLLCWCRASRTTFWSLFHGWVQRTRELEQYIYVYRKSATSQNTASYFWPSLAVSITRAHFGKEYYREKGTSISCFNCCSFLPWVNYIYSSNWGTKVCLG